jgi:hypothetical protein
MLAFFGALEMPFDVLLYMTDNLPRTMNDKGIISAVCPKIGPSQFDVSN